MSIFEIWLGILQGFRVTALVTLYGLAFAIPFGLVFGVAQYLTTGPARLVVTSIIEFWRSSAVIILLFVFYYALPIVLSVELPAWLAAGLGLTLYMGAFSTEIFRGGIISIDKGQWQASRALGMTWPEMMRHIILPQAIKRMTPPFVNQSIIQLKNTSLLYVVAIPDLMYTGSIIVSDTFRPLEVYTVVAIAYFVILYPLTLYAARLEARVDQ